MGACKMKFVIWAPDYQVVRAGLMLMYKKYGWNYLVMGDEVCPTTGKQHVDGYYQCPNPRKWSTENNKFVKLFSKGYGDLQEAKGTPGENFDYSSKENRNVTEMGEAITQGARVDLLQRKEAILSGKITVEEICVEDPEQYHQYGRTLQKLEDIALRKKFRNWMTTCDWLWGPTGVGKSHRAFEGYDPDKHYLWRDDNGWQDGYRGQEYVIINDFRGNTDIKYNTLLQLIDKWPTFVSRRGREPAPFLAKHIIITCSLPPEKVYKNLAEDSIDQLLRRVRVEFMQKVDFTGHLDSTPKCSEGNTTTSEQIFTDEELFDY